MDAITVLSTVGKAWVTLVKDKPNEDQDYESFLCHLLNVMTNCVNSLHKDASVEEAKECLKRIPYAALSWVDVIQTGHPGFFAEHSDIKDFLSECVEKAIEMKVWADEPPKLLKLYDVKLQTDDGACC